jgi:hypothetical protein
MDTALYVIVRTHLPSMTPGKAQAQSGHAANAFNYFMTELSPKKKNTIQEHWLKGWVEWKVSTRQGFGTQINLKAPNDQALQQAFYALGHDIAHESVIDPTYPYMVDEELFPLIDKSHHTLEPRYNPSTKLWTCFREETTAAWIFDAGFDAADIKKATSDFILHP